MQRLGQHYMVSRAAIRTIVAALDITRGDTVIEIGPGKGAITIPIAKRCNEVGCRVIAIEKDKRLVSNLQLVISNLNLKSEILEGDVLKILSALVLKLEIKNWKLVGNIPYYITGKLLRILSALPVKPALAVLTIQREVAERLIAEPPEMNLLAAATQVWTKPKILRTLKPNDFSPQPKVTSAIVMLTTNHVPLATREAMGQYYRLIKALFKQPRKTIWNNLRAGLPHDAEMLGKILRVHGFPMHARPGELSLEVLIKLAASFG